MSLKHDVKAVGSGFRIYGQFISAIPYGSGHINDTYAATYDQGGTIVRYIHQRINENIFKNIPGLMENIDRVTRHSFSRVKETGGADASRNTLTLIPSKDGQPFYVDPDGGHWRTYIFIEKARTYDAIQSVAQAQEVARAFGEFQKLLVDIPGGRLVETIPNFHHTRSRLDTLKKAIEENVAGRKSEVQKEIDFVLSREDVVDVLLNLQAEGKIPERITHNDTKLNNVMLDDQTGKSVCVIDLDTVMPGLVLYDFGDMVRTATSPALEDEKDLSKVAMQMNMFAALAEGYLSSASDFLCAAEIEHLAFSGKLITLEIGIRFLTDFLQGDIYFKTKRPEHNLDRCRTQFRLVECIESAEGEMQDVVEKLVGKLV